MASKREYAPHEGLFHKVFRNPDNTKYFLRQHLSPDIQRSIDLDSLRLENVSYVDDNLRKHFADLVFSLMLKGEELPSVRVYLLFEDFQKALSYLPEGGEKIMDTLADQWMEQGEQNGFIKGEIKNAREMLLEAISERFGAINPDLVRRINSIESHETLKMLFKQTFRFESLEEFKEQVLRATDN